MISKIQTDKLLCCGQNSGVEIVTFLFDPFSPEDQNKDNGTVKFNKNVCLFNWFCANLQCLTWSAKIPFVYADVVCVGSGAGGQWRRSTMFPFPARLSSKLMLLSMVGIITVYLYIIQIHHHHQQQQQQQQTTGSNNARDVKPERQR